MPSSDTPPCRSLGFFRRHTVWLPTWKGWLLLGFIATSIAVGFFHSIHSFLAVNAPVEARVMVVEGWIPMSALQSAADRFRSDQYLILCAVGGPMPGEPHSSQRNYGAVVADQFLEMGIPENQIHAVSSGEPKRDRTYTSASVLREWFLKSGNMPTALDVVTVGTHSRRSRLLFDAAFEHKVRVGVISLPNQDYDPRRWWDSSEGVKDVLSELVSYVYAKLFF